MWRAPAQRTCSSSCTREQLVRVAMRAGVHLPHFIAMCALVYTTCAPHSLRNVGCCRHRDRPHGLRPTQGCEPQRAGHRRGLPAGGVCPAKGLMRPRVHSGEMDCAACRRGPILVAHTCRFPLRRLRAGGVCVLVVRLPVAGAADQAVRSVVHVHLQRAAHGARVLHRRLELRAEVRASQQRDPSCA